LAGFLGALVGVAGDERSGDSPQACELGEAEPFSAAQKNNLSTSSVLRLLKCLLTVRKFGGARTGIRKPRQKITDLESLSGELPNAFEASFNLEQRFTRVLGGIEIAINLAKQSLDFGGGGH